ncbi:DUF4279 domain-containing protein [Burkholderia sp. Ax-1724]|uniref:DUF4279 domain-containing protein n=2 Tax=Burkholderiales TaxID=80840 RepID=UPI0031F484C6
MVWVQPITSSGMTTVTCILRVATSEIFMAGRTEITPMKDHQLAHATFYISGDSLEPAFWSAYFNVKPDLAITRGQPFITPSGRPSRIPGRVGLWRIGSEVAVRSNSLEPHLRYLVERLGLPRADLRQILVDNGARMRFFCYWYNERGDRVPDVPDDIRTMMGAMGGTVEIDEHR